MDKAGGSEKEMCGNWASQHVNIFASGKRGQRVEGVGKFGMLLNGALGTSDRCDASSEETYVAKPKVKEEQVGRNRCEDGLLRVAVNYTHSPLYGLAPTSRYRGR